MDDYTASTYGDRIAERYDEWYAEVPSSGDVERTVAFLREIAAGGTALELGIGTGRVAIPLRAAGVDVSGIDASTAMVERLHAKPGGAEIPVTIGDFRTFALERRFALIYVVFNTFFGLLTQDDQVEAFRAIASHLQPGGVFVMEAFVPDAGRYDRGQRFAVMDVADAAVHVEASQHDPVAQLTTSQRIVIGERGVEFFPVRIRYAYPAELDLMARIAGLALRDRWGDWDRSAFTALSGKHISVWAKAS
jgi:SAM-dependent methyltransferase